jgi:hypothetical protein
MVKALLPKIKMNLLSTDLLKPLILKVVSTCGVILSGFLTATVNVFNVALQLIIFILLPKKLKNWLISKSTIEEYVRC